jgi:dienelactone hydrolase
MKKIKILLFGFVLVTFMQLTIAAVTERRVFTPVEVKLNSGEVIRRDMEMVVFEDDAAKIPRPVIVFGHGYLGFERSLSTWAWLFSHRKSLQELVKLGFHVVMPMRIGQGETGGLTLEGGSCNKSADEFEIRIGYIQTQLIQAAQWVKNQPFTKQDQILYLGQSAGGVVQ